MVDEDLPPSYVKRCERFLRQIKEWKKANKPQAPSFKRHETDTKKG